MLAIVEAVRFSKPARFSRTERERLATHGDAEAQAEATHVARQPLFESLHKIILNLVRVSFVLATIVWFGWAGGTVIATVGLVLVPIVFRIPLVCGLADKLRDIALPMLEKLVLTVTPLLQLLRDREISEDNFRLNSQTELLKLVESSPGILSQDELRRLRANLEFDERTVGSVMTPRSMIRSVPAEEVMGPLVIDELYKTGYSRFPVYKKDIDHMVGVLYTHDLMDLKVENKTASDAMRKNVYYIHEAKSLSHALHGFLKTNHHLFVVVNDYRETVGLLSLEDVLEALIGKKIVDEFDAFDDLRVVAEGNPGKNNQPKGRKDI